jgi:hypothetical protein
MMQAILLPLSAGAQSATEITDKQVSKMIRNTIEEGSLETMPMEYLDTMQKMAGEVVRLNPDDAKLVNAVAQINREVERRGAVIESHQQSQVAAEASFVNGINAIRSGTAGLKDIPGSVQGAVEAEINARIEVLEQRKALSPAQQIILDNYKKAVAPEVAADTPEGIAAATGISDYQAEFVDAKIRDTGSVEAVLEGMVPGTPLYEYARQAGGMVLGEVAEIAPEQPLEAAVAPEVVRAEVVAAPGTLEEYKGEPIKQTLKRRTVPTGLVIAEKQKIKSQIKQGVETGNIPEGSAIRFTDIGYLVNAIRQGKLPVGKSAEGRAGISASMVRKGGASPIAYGSSKQHSVAIEIPSEYIEGRGQGPNEVLISEDAPMSEMKFRIDAHDKVYTLAELEGITGEIFQEEAVSEAYGPELVALKDEIGSEKIGGIVHALGESAPTLRVIKKENDIKHFDASDNIRDAVVAINNDNVDAITDGNTKKIALTIEGIKANPAKLSEYFRQFITYYDLSLKVPETVARKTPSKIIEAVEKRLGLEVEHGEIEPKAVREGPQIRAPEGAEARRGRPAERRPTPGERVEEAGKEVAPKPATPTVTPVAPAKEITRGPTPVVKSFNGDLIVRGDVREYAEEIKNLPGAKWSEKQKAWTFPETSKTVLEKFINDIDIEGRARKSSDLSIAPSSDVTELTVDFVAPSERMWHLIRRRYQDYFLPIKRLQKAIEKAGGKITEDMDVAQAHTLFGGKIGRKWEKVIQDHRDVLMKFLSDKKLSIEELDIYRYAKHAHDRNTHIADINPRFSIYGENAGSGMPYSTANNIMASFGREGRLDNLEKAREMVQEVEELRLKTLVEYGLESKSTIDKWRKDFGPYYAPLKGMYDKEGNLLEESQIPKVGQGYDVRGRESKKALGRSSLAKNLTINTFMQLEETIVRAEMAHVGRTFLNLVRAFPNDKVWKINPVEFRQGFNNRTGEVETERKAVPGNSFAVKEGAKEYHIAIYPDSLRNAMKSMSPKQMGPFFRFLTAYGQYFKAVSTQFTPEFPISNFAKDIQAAIIHITGEQSTKMAAKTVKNVGPAMVNIFRVLHSPKAKGYWPDMYRRFADVGGRIYFHRFEKVEQTEKKMLRQIRAMKGGVHNAERAFMGIFDFVSDINMAVENSSRLALFEVLVNNGYSDEQAAVIAKDLTVNFETHGEVGGMIEAFYPFFNAGLQGSVRAARAIRHPKVQAMAFLYAVGGYYLTSMNIDLGGEDEDGILFIDKIDDWIKENNFIFIKPASSRIYGEARKERFKHYLKEGLTEREASLLAEEDALRRTYYKIPMAHSYGVFYNVGRLINDVQRGAKDPIEASIDMAGIIFNQFNPVGGETSANKMKHLAKLISPSILDPVAQIAMNENFFGAPVKPTQSTFVVQKPNSQMYWQSVRPTSRWITSELNRITTEEGGVPGIRGGRLDISPEDLDHLYDGYTSGAGRFARQTLDYIVDKFMGDETPIHETPIKRRVMGDIPSYYTPRKYYEIATEIKTVSKEYESLIASGDREGARSFYKEHKDTILLNLKPIQINRLLAGKDRGSLRKGEAKPPLKLVEERVQDLRDREDKVWAMKIPERQRRLKLRAIDTQINQIMKKFTGKYNEKIKGGN